MNKPRLFFLVGLSGSGKSTFSKSIIELVKPIEVFSSDKIREELPLLNHRRKDLYELIEK